MVVIMDRRIFTKLLALSPLAFLVREKPYEFHCLTCGLYQGRVEWPMVVKKEGEVFCVDHATHHPLHTPGRGLVTDFAFGAAPGGWRAYQRAHGMHGSEPKPLLIFV